MSKGESRQNCYQLDRRRGSSTGCLRTLNMVQRTPGAKGSPNQWYEAPSATDELVDAIAEGGFSIVRW